MSTTKKIMFGRPWNLGGTIKSLNVYYGMLHSVNYAMQKGWDVDDEIAGKACIKDNIYAHLESSNPQMFFGCGHGNPDFFMDEDNELVWKVNSLPPDNLAGRFVYLLSCNTAVELGPDIVEKGAINYLGFLTTWGWICEDGRPHQDPYDDSRAKGFYQAANEYAMALFDGCTAQEAYDRSYDKYTEWIDYWKDEGSSDPRSSYIISWLLRDRDNMALYGNKNGKLKKEIEPPPGVIDDDIDLFIECEV